MEGDRYPVQGADKRDGTTGKNLFKFDPLHRFESGLRASLTRIIRMNGEWTWWKTNVSLLTSIYLDR